MNSILQRSLELLDEASSRSDSQRRAIFAKLKGKAAFSRGPGLVGAVTSGKTLVTPMDWGKGKKFSVSLTGIGTRGSEIRKLIAKNIRDSRAGKISSLSGIGFGASMGRRNITDLSIIADKATGQVSLPERRAIYQYKSRFRKK